jgi:predicted DNA-binding antitoxin AbrB/MazE fold protein
MAPKIRAVVQGGALVPCGPLDLPEGAEVDLLVESSAARHAKVTDPEEKKRILKEVVESMRSNPIPEGAPPLPFSRDWMHERR